MNNFEKIIYLFQGTMNTPKSFGLYHIMWLFLTFLTIFLLYKQEKIDKNKILSWIIGIYGVISLILEIIKQLIWSMNYDITLNVVTWDFQWYSFPFQLCTTPMIVCLILFFLKNENIRKYLYCYLSFVTILGSLAVAIIPTDCFVSDIWVNIHAMWLHLGSLVISIYLLVTKTVEINKQNLKNAFVVFILFLTFALLLNIIMYNSGILNGETFNMFYISPYFISSLPIFNIIQQNVPYIVFLFLYILAIFFRKFNYLYMRREHPCFQTWDERRTQ